MPTITISQECPECEGTGLYSGMAERDGIYVVCSFCKGSGKYDQAITYKEFTERKCRPDALHVIQTNPGFVVGTTGPNGKKYEATDFGGISYEQWKLNPIFPSGSEMRKFTCPQWYYQCANSRKMPNWPACRSCFDYRECPQFEHKDDCWARWDKEQKV